MLRDFTEIENHAREMAVDPLLVACVEPHDPTMIIAIERAMRNRLVKPVMIGDEEAITKASKEVGIETRGWELVRSTDPNSSTYQALELVRDNRVNAICKGVFGVKDFLSLLFERKPGFRLKGGLVSAQLVCRNEKLDRLLIIADPVVNPHPELMDVIAILNNAVAFAHRLGDDSPKAAILAAVELIYPQMPVTMMAAVIAKMADKGQIKGCAVDGPLSFDVAIDSEAASAKGASGAVAGAANVLIAPNLAVSYGMYRALALFTESQIGIVLTGGKVPVVVTSGFDTPETKYNSLLLSVLAA